MEEMEMWGQRDAWCSSGRGGRPGGGQRWPRQNHH